MVMMCFWLTTEAQAIFDLTASQVRIDSLLPVFTWQKPLGPHYADSVYTVSIAYPEFINMSEADIRRYQEISGAPLPTLPTVTQHVSVARKQGLLDVSFVPLVYRNGRYQKLVSFMLDVKAKPVLRAATRAEGEPSRYADHSVLREGTQGQKANPRAMPTIPYFVKAHGQRSVCQQRVSINSPTS